MFEQIQNYIQQGQYAQAKRLIEEEQVSSSSYINALTILDAEIYRATNDRQNMFLSIQKGLIFNYKNYELYFMLPSFLLYIL